MSNLKDEATRKSLLHKSSGFNQTRNAVYWLQRLMKQYNLDTTEINERLQRMGKNIGGTIAQELEFTPTSSNSVEDYIYKLYKLILHSKIKITQSGNIITIEDPKCPLCKYQYPDIQVPGCTIVPSMVNEIAQHQGLKLKNSIVLKSKTLGDSICVHQYEIDY